MARYIDANCKLCRREGIRLYLKGERCFTDKCAVERRGYAPGQHGRASARRFKGSDYALRLREKQKAKRIYGILEKQFRNYFIKGAKESGVTGENLLVSLESRLDNIVYRLGFCPSRKSARQLIRHRHFMVNDRIVDIPSYSVSPGNEVAVKKKSRQLGIIQVSIENHNQSEMLPWLSVDYKSMVGRMLTIPTRDEVPVSIQEQLIVELYSK